MNEAEAALRRASLDLDETNVAWALVGGFALAALVEPRFTRDVDLAVAVTSDEAAERVVFALGSRGYVLDSTVEQKAMGRLATARLLSPTGQTAKLYVDLLFASSGIETEIVRDAERIVALPGLRLPVARIGHLIAIKLLATNENRPQDAFDLANLRNVAEEVELARAAEAIELIEARGYARDRDLKQMLAALIAQPASD